MTFSIHDGEVHLRLDQGSKKRVLNEVSIVVRSYVAMRNAILSGQKIVKKQVYEPISQQEAFLKIIEVRNLLNSDFATYQQ